MGLLHVAIARLVAIVAETAYKRQEKYSNFAIKLLDGIFLFCDMGY
jgi:hypothetical protein